MRSISEGQVSPRTERRDLGQASVKSLRKNSWGLLLLHLRSPLDSLRRAQGKELRAEAGPDPTHCRSLGTVLEAIAQSPVSPAVMFWVILLGFEESMP